MISFGRKGDSAFISLILILMLPLCLIDSVNGFLMMNGAVISLSGLYKLVILLLMIVPLVGNLLTLSIVLSLMFVLMSQSVLTSNFILDITTNLRSLIFGISFIYFFCCKDKLNSTHLKLVEFVFIVNFCVVAVNVFSGVFGFGYTTYGGKPASQFPTLGFKGYFYAGNEIGPLIICMYPVVIAIFYNNYLKRSAINILFLSVCLLVGTKTSILGMLILVIYDIWRLCSASIKGLVIFILFAGIGSIALGAVFVGLYNEKRDLFVYFFENKGLLYLIFSGRENFLIESLNFVSNHFSFMKFITGVGVSYAESRFKSVEIDPIDIFIWSGFLGVGFIYIVFFVFSFVNYKLSKNACGIYFILCYFLLFFISCIAGHVFTSAMMLPFLGLHFVFLYARFIRSR